MLKPSLDELYGQTQEAKPSLDELYNIHSDVPLQRTSSKIAEIAFTPISKQLTGRTIGDRTDFLNKAGNNLVNYADKETQENLNNQVANNIISGKRKTIEVPKTPGIGSFFMNQLPAATAQAGVNLADVSPADLALMAGTEGAGRIPVGETSLGKIATKVPLRNPLNSVGRKAMGEDISALQEIGKSDKLEKYANIYRNVLAPGKGDINKVEVKSGKNIDDYYKLAAKEGVVIQSKEGKLDTTLARNSLQEKANILDSQVSDILSSDTTKRFNLNDVRIKAKKNLRKNIQNDADYESAASVVDNEINAAIKNRGELVNGQDLNAVKQGMWSKSYNLLEPNTKYTARQIGFVAKDMIERAYPDANIRNINKKLGDYLTLESLLNNAHGRVVQKGKIGRYVAQMTGALAGHALHMPVIGELSGAWLGGKVSDFMTNPERITGDISRKSGRLIPKESIVPEILNKSQESPKLLPPPQPSYLKERQTMDMPSLGAQEKFPKYKEPEYQLRQNQKAIKLGGPQNIQIDKDGRQFIQDVKGDRTYLDKPKEFGSEFNPLNNPSPSKDKNKVIKAIGAGAVGLGLLSSNSQAAENIDMNKIYQIESSGNPSKWNKKEDARGLGQIRPKTLEDWNNYHHKDKHTGGDLFKPDVNKKIAEWYMNVRIPQLLKSRGLKDTVANRLIAYNAGIRNVSNPSANALSYLKKYGVKK